MGFLGTFVVYDPKLWTISCYLLPLPPLPYFKALFCCSCWILRDAALTASAGRAVSKLPKVSQQEVQQAITVRKRCTKEVWTTCYTCAKFKFDRAFS